MAVFLVATMGAIALVDNGSDNSEAGFIIDSETEGLDYVKTSGSYSFTIENTYGEKVYCKWNLNNSAGKSQSNSTVTIANGAKETVTLTAPSTAGNYTFVVKFYNNEDKKDDQLITERQKSLKVVEPVTIKVTFENKSATKLTFNAYLKIKDGNDWKKVDGSDKDVTVTARVDSTDTNGTGTYTYEYVVRDLDRVTHYKICSDDDVAKDGKIVGLDKEMQFYTYQNNYDFVTWFMVIVLLILIILIIWIYRKPVKNFGKPKGRK